MNEEESNEEISDLESEARTLEREQVANEMMINHQARIYIVRTALNTFSFAVLFLVCFAASLYGFGYMAPYFGAETNSIPLEDIIGLATFFKETITAVLLPVITLVIGYYFGRETTSRVEVSD